MRQWSFGSAADFTKPAVQAEHWAAISNQPFAASWPNLQVADKTDFLFDATNDRFVEILIEKTARHTHPLCISF